MIHDLAQERVEVRDGMIEIPDTPGLGLSINEDVVKKFAVS